MPYFSRYGSCLGHLEKLKPNLLLDIHLHGHVETLYTDIRHKAIIQYTLPFISVDLNTMATAFKTSVSMLEKELAALITENKIQVLFKTLKLLILIFLYILCVASNPEIFAGPDRLPQQDSLRKAC